MACVVAASSLTARADASAPATLVAEAAVPWHANLAAAKQASLVSHRPVLAIFTAGSTESGIVLSRDVFPAAETVALLTACFEPVLVDVDADPSTARSLGISQVPTACIIDAHDRPLSRFDCPPTAAAFVAAASRAVQEAATAGAVTPTAAIREQSDFVNQATQPSAAPFVPAPGVPGLDATTGEEPMLPTTPPAWPAEPATRPMPVAPNAVVAPPQRPGIEPAAAGTLTPWLATQQGSAVAAVPPATQAAASAPAPTLAPPSAPAKPSASASFFAALQKPFSIFTKPKATDVAATPATPAATGTAAQGQPTAAPDPHGSMPLGLEGYCPVSLVDKGSWVEGRAQWGARHRGRTYLFAGAEQQRAFLADPDRYAPALSGDDPVLACDSGKQVTGQRRYGVSYQSRMYLFSSPETRASFAANPQRYIERVIVAERPATAGSTVR